MKQVIDAINSAFAKAYPSNTLSQPTEDPEILKKRVDMIVDDLLCTRVNFSVTNKHLCELDRKIRGIREHWWQFWRRG